MNSARFGSRYGSRIRKRVANIENTYKWTEQVCPFCGEKAVSRIAGGVFKCGKCGKKFAGGAYQTETLSKRITSKLFDKRGKVLTKNVEVEKLEKELEKANEDEETEEKQEKKETKKKSKKAEKEEE